MQYYIDPQFANLVPGKIPDNWYSRAMFRSPEACQVWLARVSEDHAPERFPDLLLAYKELLAQIEPVRTFVSFGPGGSSLDLKLIEKLKNPLNINYIPIDIAPSLLHHTCNLIRKQYQVPLCIEGDFEGGMNFISSVLKSQTQTPTIYSILGNALGNADIGDHHLINSLCDLIPSHQLLFLSIATGRFKNQHMQNPKQLAFWNSVRDLITCGIAMISGETPLKVVESIDNRLILQMGLSEVPGSSCMQFFDTITNKLVFSTKRYDYKMFINWVEESYPLILIDSRNVVFPGSDVGVGCYLFKKQI